MTPAPKRDLRIRAARLWSALPAALAFGLAAWQAALPWTIRNYVTQDGPSHLYAAMVAKAVLWGHETPYSGIYSLQGFKASNWGTVAVFGALSSLFGPSHAEQATASLCVIVGFFSLAYFIRSLDPRVRPWSPVLNFVLCTYFLWIGFYNFYLGMAVLPLVVGYYIRRMGRMSVWRTAALAGGLVALFLIHALTMALALFTMGVAWFWAYVASPLVLHEGRTGCVRGALRAAAWLALAAAPTAVLLLIFMSGSPHKVSHGDPVSAWTSFGIGVFNAAGGRTGHELLLYPAMLFYMAIGALSLRHRELATPKTAVFAAAVCIFALYLIAPDEAFGASALRMRLVWAVILLGCAAATVVARLRAIQCAAGVYVACMLAGTLVTVRDAFAHLSRAVDAYASAMARIPPGSTFVRVRFPTGRMGERFAFQDLEFDPVCHIDAFVAAKRKLVDLSDYQAGREVFAVRFTDRVPADLRHPLWMLEGATEDTTAMLREVLDRSPLPIDYVVVVGDNPPSDKASDFNRTIAELNSRMTLEAADPQNACVRVYRRR